MNRPVQTEIIIVILEHLTDGSIKSEIMKKKTQDWVFRQVQLTQNTSILKLWEHPTTWWWCYCVSLWNTNKTKSKPAKTGTRDRWEWKAQSSAFLQIHQKQTIKQKKHCDVKRVNINIALANNTEFPSPSSWAVVTAAVVFTEDDVDLKSNSYFEKVF